MRDCPSLRGRDKVRSTGVVVGSSSLVRPPRPRPQVLEGGGGDQRELPGLRESQRHPYASAGRQNPEYPSDINPGIFFVKPLWYVRTD